MARSKKVQFWVNEIELERLESLAKREGVGVSEYLRRLIDREYHDKND